jgi:hypothetical protein
LKARVRRAPLPRECLVRAGRRRERVAVLEVSVRVRKGVWRGPERRRRRSRGDGGARPAESRGPVVVVRVVVGIGVGVRHNDGR